MRGQTSRLAHRSGVVPFALLREKFVLLAAIMMLGVGLIGTPTTWANNLTFQNVTFNMTVNAGGNLELNIVNALNATGNWAGVTHLKAFQINNFGTASGLSVGGASTVLGGLSNGGAGGCNGSGSGACFNFGLPGFVLTNDFTFTILRTSGSFNLNLPDGEGSFGPHLKVCFVDDKCAGDLLSKTIPVPGTVLMFGLGFAMFVLWYHLRSRKQVAFAPMV